MKKITCGSKLWIIIDFYWYFEFIPVFQYSLAKKKIAFCKKDKNLFFFESRINEII